MTYIAIRRDALEEIVSARLLQSTEYEDGLQLARVLQTGLPANVSTRIGMKQAKGGLIIFSSKPSQTQFVVIDIAQCNGFKPGDNLSHSLTFLQKLLRFSAKYWQGAVMKRSEIVNKELSRGIVFPFPISQQTDIRIVVDLAPDGDRLAKRGKAGRYLLAFKVAEDGANADQSPTLGTFRRFQEDLDELNHQLVASAPPDDELSIAALSATSLTRIDQRVDPHQDYQTWLHLLTNDQRKFVTSPLTSPKRVDGPAGSGKTVSLSLAAVHAMISAEKQGKDHQAIFLTHSEASRRSIETILMSMGADRFISNQPASRRLQVMTLQGYCTELLRTEISLTELVDPDALDAKQLQTMYVEEAFKLVEDELPTFSRFMSAQFRDFVEQEARELVISMIKHEISVVLKGRSRENFDVYKRVPPLSTGLPISNEGDKSFVWRVYEHYREQLEIGGQFDTDDVVLTALSQLTTPIWRRRRSRDGFDAVFIDETHLFNMNELSVFHHLTKTDIQFPIAFAVDRSQAIGDRGWLNDIDVSVLIPGKQVVQENRTDLRSIFRSSPDIVNLAFTVTSSGASLFTNFEDPLRMAHSNMSFEEEKKAETPTFTAYANDDAMIEAAFDIADRMRTQMGASRGDIAIIAFDDKLFAKLQQTANSQGRPVEILKQRNDMELARRARSMSRFIISVPDYVGGLEFDGVVLVGVDEGRVPPVSVSQRSESKEYMSYSSHNRLYVAISRARYRVAILGTSERGPSSLLKAALASDALIEV